MPKADMDPEVAALLRRIAEEACLTVQPQAREARLAERLLTAGLVRRLSAPEGAATYVLAGPGVRLTGADVIGPVASWSA